MSGPESKTRDWNAVTYDRISTPQQQWAKPVIERLKLKGDETVLDAGCGSGLVTQMLVDALPEGRVIGVDGSPSMIAEARINLGDGAHLLVSDLLELKLSETVDAVFSNATYHWVKDHERLFKLTVGYLDRGGRFVAQCGGEGNIGAVVVALEAVTARQKYAEFFDGWDGPWNFAAPAETEQRLSDAGFEVSKCWLEERPTLVPEDDARDFLETVCIGTHKDRVPPHLQSEFVDDVYAELSDPTRFEYVRLNFDAVKV